MLLNPDNLKGLYFYIPDESHNKLLFSKINLIKTGTGKK